MKITAEMLPPEERAKDRLPALRLTPKARGFTLTAARAAFLILCAVAMIAAPDPWMRAGFAVPIVVTAYAVGWFDGRRALAVELLGGRRDDRRTRLAPEQGGEPEGD